MKRPQATGVVHEHVPLGDWNVCGGNSFADGRISPDLVWSICQLLEPNGFQLLQRSR